MMLFILTTLLIAVSATSQCSGTRIDSCPQRVRSQGCSNFYQWAYNASTAEPIWHPYQCADVPDPDHPWCRAVDPSCGVLCAPKGGGPNGKICTQLGPAPFNCVPYYADHYGDRWCWWDYFSNSCREGPLCWS